LSAIQKLSGFYYGLLGFELVMKNRNGVKLNGDKPKELWPTTPEGGIHMYTQQLDMHGLMRKF